MKEYTNDQITRLAALAAADYAAACSGPTIRGKNGEKHLRGSSIQEVAEKNNLTVTEAEELTVDLASASWEELSLHWQKVNLDSANVMIAIMESIGGEEVVKAIDLSDEEQATRYGTLLHAAWLQQPANSWALGGDLDKPFSELPKSEQDKDLQQLRSLQKWLSEIG